MKLGRDKVLMAQHMHTDVFAISGADPERGKVSHGGPLLQKTSSLVWKATATN